MFTFTQPTQCMKHSALAFVLAVLLAACSNSIEEGDRAVEGFQDVEDLHIVDCLLPGKVHRLGGTTYLSDRRGARTTANDCRIRGGEYVAYDRADYRSALKVWLKTAEKGDAEAQTYVGEIFEKGLGQEADFVSAALWYEKAANQGFSRAQINLGYLYENGLGVEKDIARALNLYRAASGSEDELVLASTAKDEMEKLRKDLTGKVSAAKRESSYLQKQLAQAKKQGDTLKQEIVPNKTHNEDDPRLSEAQGQIALLQKLYDRSRTELEELTHKVASLPPATYRSLDAPELLKPLKLANTDSTTFKNMDFGRYFALIIGNQDYVYLDDLSSPRQDALRLKEVLETNYGFSTVMLYDANEKEILNAFNDLYNQIGPKDNLLVFYAGHGNLSQSANSKRKRGYWLPSNAEEEVLTNWISNSVISDHLDRIKARSILVVADSCFAGNLASEKSAFLLGGLNTNLSQKSIEVGLSRRSRIVISSGGEKPVLDGVQGQHSIFANALIKLLENNEGILRDNMLFAQVAVNVRRQAKHKRVDQTPEMRPIRAAGHEGGDFYFIPKNTSQAQREAFAAELALAH